jgi:nucleoside-diphosphate-sugar epimerase
VETIRANVVGTLTLADVCKQSKLLLINFATGCIFEYDNNHQLGSGIGFKEEDTPNFFGSYYSKTKAMVSTWMMSHAIYFQTHALFCWLYLTLFFQD